MCMQSGKYTFFLLWWCYSVNDFTFFLQGPATWVHMLASPACFFSQALYTWREQGIAPPNYVEGHIAYGLILVRVKVETGTLGMMLDGTWRKPT